MNTEIHNCYNEDHLNIQANYYCVECKTYMCKKCENFHQKLFKKHNIYNLDKTKNISDIFTGFCKEENHTDKLEYFCKSHNKLCCAACIAKVKAKDKGQHSECEICVLEEIKESKVNKLKENISNLEKLAKDIDKEINELKITFQTINQNREDLKLNTQKIFTKIRNTINDREDEILLKIDELFNNAYMKENEMNDIDKYPKKIKSLLDKGKSTLDDLKNENKLNSLINNCIEIEKNLIDINSTEKNLKKCKEEKNESIKFIPSEGSELKNFISTIENFGKIIKENKNKEPLNDIQMEINNNNENHILDFQIKSTNEELNGFSFKLFNFSEKEYNLYYPNNLEYNDDEIVWSIHLDNKNNSFDALKNLPKPFSIRDINQKLIIDFNFKSDNKKLLYLYDILINNNNISLALKSNFNFEKLKKENFEDCFNDLLTFNFSTNGDLKNIENSLLLTKPKIKDEKLQKEIESTAKFLMAFNIRKFNMIISKDKLNDFLIFIDKKKELIKFFDFIIETRKKLFLPITKTFGIEAKEINKILATFLNPRCKSGLVLEINAKGINEFVNELNEQKEE